MVCATPLPRSDGLGTVLCVLQVITFRRPVVAAVAVTVAWLAVQGMLLATLPALTPEALPDLGAIVINLGALMVPLTVILAAGWSQEAGLSSARPDRNWLVLLPLFFVAVSFAVPGLGGSATAVLSSALLFAVLGINEELLSRGLVQHLLGPLGATRSVSGVAVLFGLQHATNAWFFGQPPLETIAQVVSATAFGAAYAAARRRLTTIWPLAFLHGLDNFCQTRSPGDAPRWWHLLVALLLTTYAVALVRRERRPA